MSDIFNLADTWNDAGTTFTAIKMNVTDTASNAASLLMDLQVGGVSKFKVDKAGSPFFNTPTKAIEITDPYGFRLTTGTTLDFTITATAVARMAIASGWSVDILSFGRSSGYGTRLQQDETGVPHVIAQRNGVNAQTSRIYNTYTNASNYERLSIGWAANVMTIGAEAAGTGTKRNIVLDGANRATYSETAADIAAALVAHGIMAPA